MFSSILRRVTQAPAARGEVLRASVREMAKKSDKKKRIPIDPLRGWVPIQGKLDAVPLQLPQLLSLKACCAPRPRAAAGDHPFHTRDVHQCRAPQVVFGRCGNGHTAARHFCRQHLPQFRWLHPEADVSQRNSKMELKSIVTLTVLGADPVEVDVTGLKHRSDVLRKVLEAGKMSAKKIELAVTAAKEMRDVTVDSNGYMGNIPVKTHGTPPRVVHVPQKKKVQEQD